VLEERPVDQRFVRGTARAASATDCIIQRSDIIQPNIPFGFKST